MTDGHHSAQTSSRSTAKKLEIIRRHYRPLGVNGHEVTVVFVAVASEAEVGVRRSSSPRWGSLDRRTVLGCRPTLAWAAKVLPPVVCPLRAFHR
jgi:hypothetical protein